MAIDTAHHSVMQRMADHDLSPSYVYPTAQSPCCANLSVSDGTAATKRDVAPFFHRIKIKRLEAASLPEGDLYVHNKYVYIYTLSFRRLRPSTAGLMNEALMFRLFNVLIFEMAS